MRNGFIDVNIELEISRAIAVGIFQSEDVCYADMPLPESVIREFAFTLPLLLIKNQAFVFIEQHRLLSLCYSRVRARSLLLGVSLRGLFLFFYRLSAGACYFRTDVRSVLPSVIRATP